MTYSKAENDRLNTIMGEILRKEDEIYILDSRDKVRRNKYELSIKIRNRGLQDENTTDSV